MKDQEKASAAGRELSRRGASKGGKARAESMSAEARSEQARIAAMERWESETPRATHGDLSKPLKLGGLELPCYVLADGRRMLSGRGMHSALGFARGGERPHVGGSRLANFVLREPLVHYVSKDLLAALQNPIRFLPPHGGNPAHGYEANVLVDVCDAILTARQKRSLSPAQRRVAKQCEILTRALARTGIVALIDEVTGYQDVRAKNALALILERFIAEEIRKWVKTFPDDFYREMFRLRGWEWPPVSARKQKPSFVGKLTNQMVYERLAPGVLDELKRRTPRDDMGRAKSRYHQWLSEETGHPKLREHLAVTVALMKVSQNWTAFERRLDLVAPRFNHPYLLELPDGE